MQPNTITRWEYKDNIYVRKNSCRIRNQLKSRIGFRKNHSGSTAWTDSILVHLLTRKILMVEVRTERQKGMKEVVVVGKECLWERRTWHLKRSPQGMPRRNPGWYLENTSQNSSGKVHCPTLHLAAEKPKKRRCFGCGSYIFVKSGLAA